MPEKKIILSFNGGELSPLMDSRLDQEKYAAGCRTLENFFPLIYGGAERRSGTEYIYGCYSNSAKSRLIPFEHSVDDTYILEFANQNIRVFRAGGAVLNKVGTEDLSSLNNIIGHWLLNDNVASQAVLDDDGSTHDGTTVTSNTEDLTATGKVGTGCFNLDGGDAIYMTDDDDFSRDDSGSNPFSLTAWVYVADAGVNQTIFSKWKAGSLREYSFGIDENKKLRLTLCDDDKAFNASRIAHWKLNDNTTNTAVDDHVASIPHDGVASANTNTLSATGKISTCLDLGGSAYAAVTDHAELSFGNSTVDSPFSISAWIYVTHTGSTQVILSKWEADTPDREWYFAIRGQGDLELVLYDESEDVEIFKRTDNILAEGWHFVVATYTGQSATGSTAANLITLYVDNVAVAQTATNNANYDAMEAGDTDVVIGANEATAVPAYENYWADKLDNITLFSVELSASNVNFLWNAGNGTEDTDAGTPYRLSDIALTNGWHFVAVTYDSTGGSTAANGIILYSDGAVVASTAFNESLYAAMENTNTKPLIGAEYDSADAIVKVWQDKIDNVAMFSDVLTATEIASLYSTTTMNITSPYLTADLFQLKIESRADVMYITHPDYEPRKLSRTSHIDWTLEVLGLPDGPFRDENTDTADTITASATTGTAITLTATGHAPFVMGLDAGHKPSGAIATSKGQTGALFSLVHAVGTGAEPYTANIGAVLANANDKTNEIAVAKGVTWDYTTLGTWEGTVKLEREYGDSGVWEAIHTVTSVDNKNVEVSGTEERSGAKYRIKMTASGSAAETCDVELSLRDVSHIGIVKITEVASPTSATAEVLTTIGATNATHRWSEGVWSNYRGWPIAVSISPEERLTFAGSSTEPLTIWGSIIGDFTSMRIGDLDDDAIIFTLIGTGQQNTIRWIVPKTALMIGTVGGEHLLGASGENEVLTPSNVQAKVQTTKGSKDIQALIVDQAILFVQRGGRKVRELLYDFDADSHRADDLTVFSNHITESGIVNMNFQRTPDPVLWCVRVDGEIAVMVYERSQKVFSWSRIVTRSGDEFESAAIIYGGAGNEDEVWVTVKRSVNDSTVRYIERFKPRDWGSDQEDAFFVDSGLKYDSTSTSTITGLDHLEGETVSIWADGLVQTDKTVSGGAITLATAASIVVVGLPYHETTILKPMKLDMRSLGLATTKKISKAIVNLYKTYGGEYGPDTSNMTDFSYSDTNLYTGYKEVPFAAGYEREGDIIIRATGPAPMTVLSLTLDVGVYGD